MENENCFFFHRATEVRQHEFFKSNDWKLVELLKVSLEHKYLVYACAHELSAVTPRNILWIRLLMKIQIDVCEQW